MTILSERNKKPVFVPIQPTITKKAINSILEHYKINGFSNIWIDYTGSSLNEKQQSGVRMILSSLDKMFGDNYVVYHSHLKKELTTPVEAEFAACSDMLSQFVGADFIGCEIKPWRYAPEIKQEYVMQRGFSSIKQYQDTQIKSKARIFDPNSYYYYYPDKHSDFNNWKLNLHKILNDNSIIKSINDVYKYIEIENVKNEFDKNKKLKPYIKKKKLFIDNENIFTNIVGDVADTSWMDIF